VLVDYKVYETIYLIYRIKKTLILKNKKIKTKYRLTRFTTRVILEKKILIKFKISKYFLRSILIVSSFNVLQIICK
jgi:ribonucleotide reductase beta subunit family protein with ferritin-like domain